MMVGDLVDDAPRGFRTIGLCHKDGKVAYAIQRDLRSPPERPLLRRYALGG